MPPIPKTSDEIEIERKIILKSALDIITKYGYDKLTMRALAKECNSSPTKIYYYFKNKEHIIFQLQEYGFIILIDRVKIAVDNSDNEKNAFVNMLKTIYEFGIEEADFFNLMFGINMPRFLDYFDDNILGDVATSQKNIALGLLEIMIKITYKYGRTVNKKIEDVDVISIFTQIVGIIKLNNAKVYREIDTNHKDIFDNIIISILNNFENN